MAAPTRISGSKKQVIEQIGRLKGNIISALVWVDENTMPEIQEAPKLSDEEFLKLLEEMEAYSASAPNVDYSREAMYTRMPGE